MGVKISTSINGRLLNSKSLENALKKHLKGELDSIVQAVEFGADNASRECANELLNDSLKIVPIAKEADESNDFTFTETSIGNVRRMSEWGVFGSVEFKERAKALKVIAENHLTKGEYIQFRDYDGTMGERHYINRNAKRQRVFEHNAEALFDSGRVDKLKDEGKKLIGYKVSYDTRRTDTRSFVNNFNYAIKQHEDSTLKHAPGKTSHFLRNPYNAKRQKFLDYIAEETKKAIERQEKRGGK